MSTFRVLLKSYREEKGISQKELGEKCEPPFSTIYIAKLEIGAKKAPPKKTVLSIARALSLSPEETQQLWEAAKSERLNDAFLKASEPEVGSLLKYLMTNLSQEELASLTSQLQEKVCIPGTSLAGFVREVAQKKL